MQRVQLKGRLTRKCLAAVIVIAMLSASGVVSGAFRHEGGGSSSSSTNEEIVFLNLNEIRQSIELGSVKLDLLGKTYYLSLESVDPAIVLDGRSTRDGIAAGWGNFRTSLLGSPVSGSTAMLHVSPAGVTGFLHAGEEVILLEPLALTSPEASPEATLVRHHAASDTTSESSDGDDDEGITVQTHEVKKLIAFVDEELIQARGSFSAARTWVESIVANLNTLYSQAISGIAPQFEIIGVFSCATWPECNSTNAETLRAQWGGEVYRRCVEQNLCANFEMAHLFTGKHLDNGNTIGIAYLPGRYGITMAVNNEFKTYDGSKLFQVTRTVAHEMGHNFNARHDDGATTHQQRRPDCTSPSPIHPGPPSGSGEGAGCIWANLNARPQFWDGQGSMAQCGFGTVFIPVGQGGVGVCPTFTVHSVAHHTIMVPGSQYGYHCPECSPPIVWDMTFTTTSQNRIKACMNNGWSGDKKPGVRTC